MATTDASGLLEAVGLTNQKLIDRSEEAQDIIMQRDAAMKREVAAINTGGDAGLVVQRAKLMEDQRIAQNTNKFAQAMGTDIDSSSEIMTKLASEWKNSTMIAMQKREKLAKDMDVKFLDTPIDYIVAQFVMENTVREA